MPDSPRWKCLRCGWEYRIYMKHCPHCYFQPLEKIEPGPEADIDGRLKSLKTHCPGGHSYDDVNTYIAPDGTRHCRICRRQHKREHYVMSKMREKSTTIY